MFSCMSANKIQRCLALFQESLDIIWGVLDGPAPMNPLIASYFTKLIMMLLNKRPELVRPLHIATALFLHCLPSTVRLCLAYKTLLRRANCVLFGAALLTLQVTGYMYEKQMVFNKLISHLGTSAIMVSCKLSLALARSSRISLVIACNAFKTTGPFQRNTFCSCLW